MACFESCGRTALRNILMLFYNIMILRITVLPLTTLVVKEKILWSRLESE